MSNRADNAGAAAIRVAASPRRLLAAAVAVALLGGASGCARVTMADDIDVVFDFVQQVGPTDGLHSPYVLGASVHIFALSGDSDEKMTDWTMVSDDPTVMRISALDHSNGLRADCAAVGAGSATLRVLDKNGTEVGKGTVAVMAPDRYTVEAHGPLLVGDPRGDALQTKPLLIEGGTSTYLITWFSGEQLLHGNGVLAVDAGSSAVSASALTTFLFEDREWLQVAVQSGSAADGPGTLSLFADGKSVGPLPFVVVPTGDVASVDLIDEDESGAHEDQWLVALAQAYDAAGRPVFGVDYRWDVDGQAADGEGDLYRYQFKRSAGKMLTAHFVSMTAQAEIHSGGGYVGSSNDVGCSVGGPRKSSPAAILIRFMLGMALLCLFGLRPRRAP